MLAMVCEQSGRALVAKELPIPEPGATEVLVRVLACGVCRTDLHIVDGDLPHPGTPVIPGHEIVGEICGLGDEVAGLGLGLAMGRRIGIPWLGETCGVCRYCQTGRENLCDRPRFTGYQRPGGFAQYTVADARFCLPLPADLDPVAAAPLLCAGLIGYRSLTMAGRGRRLGLYGFGAAAHIVIQLARYRGWQVAVFTRPGDTTKQQFARELGATWSGGSDGLPPQPLDAAIIFAPAGALVPRALAAVARGGRVICAGIHMSDIPSFPYQALWGERSIHSVANLTRADGAAFLRLAAEIPVITTTTTFPLADANDALAAIRAGRLRGAAVLVP